MQDTKNEIEKLLGRRYLRHIFFWTAYVLTLTYIHGLGVNEGRYFPWFMNYLLELPVILGLSYSIVYWIIPRFLLARKFLISFLLIIMLFVIFSILNIILDNLIILPLFFRSDAGEYEISAIFRNAFGLAFPVVVFLSLSLIKFNAGKKRRKNLSEQNALRSELNFMRSRIHPLFLRDALDDIYRMSNENFVDLPEMILKVSDLLHYFLYDCDRERVLLRKEEQAIRIFMGFAKLAYKDNFNYDIQIRGDLENTKISPYIIFPLVHSVCRFNTDFDQNPGKVFIQIDISEEVLSFSASQKLYPGNQPGNYEYKWNEEINMSRKRLDLIYTWKYKLDVIETERKLIINLTLDLSE